MDSLRVLLVEDSFAQTELLKRMLAKVSDPVVSLSCVDYLSKALYLLASDAFDVVLLDLGLPDSSGLETLLKVCRAYPRLPVVVFTTEDDDALAAEAIMYGAQEYLEKGKVDPNVLGRSLKYALERKAVALRENDGLINSLVQDIPGASAVQGEARDALRQTTELFRILFHESQVGIHIVGPDLKIRRVNKACSRMLGWSEQDLLGKSAHEVTHPDDLQLVQLAFESPTTLLHQKLRCLKSNGTVVPVNRVASRIIDARGGAFAFFMDEDISLRNGSGKRDDNTDVERAIASHMVANPPVGVLRLSAGNESDLRLIVTGKLGLSPDQMSEKEIFLLVV